MKKLLLIAAAFICSITVCNAQNYEVLYVEQLVSDSVYRYCQPQVSRVIIYGQEGCEFNQFYVDGQLFENDSIILDGGYYRISFDGCDYLSVSFWLELTSSDFFNPFPSPIVWKRVGESVTIGNQWTDWTWQWSNGETSPIIEVTEPGVYTVIVSDLCGSETYSIEVRDNVEIDLATCDLESNLNMVTWPTTVAQAEYVGTVEIKRDGMVMGTVNYSDGQFIDNIGSDAASRTYTITAIGTDGNLCPITSYPKETIHMSYTLGMNNTIEIGWNTPTGYDLLGYNVCEWHESDGSLNVIDYVGASVTSYTCSQSQFDQGYIVVQGVEAGKDGETRLLSNRSMDLVGLGENEATTFKVYPNPAKDRFIVEGSGTMTVMNTLGQTILTQEIDGKATMELPQGLYFVKLGETMRKVVVE